MLLSTFPPQTSIILQSQCNSNDNFPPVFYASSSRAQSQFHCRETTVVSAQRSISLAPTSSTALRHVSAASDDAGEDEGLLLSSAAAVAAAIRGASNSPVEFVQRIEKGSGAKNKALVLPSTDFHRLCIEQLDLFRRIVNQDAILSVYVRPAGSYVMDRLELRCITSYPSVHNADIMVLVGTFTVPASLRLAESTISNLKAEFFPELGAAVFPMVTHPFVVGFLVAELPRAWNDMRDRSMTGKSFALPHSIDLQPLGSHTFKDDSIEMLKFTREQILNSTNIARSLAMAYVMDQKAMLLQQSSWQNNVRMSNLVEQIRGSLSSIRTLSKILSVQTRKNEIAYDIVEDILVQADHMRDTLQQLQDAVYLTKANMIRYNNDSLKKMQTESISSDLSNTLSNETSISSFRSSDKVSVSSLSDEEFPMPPVDLAPSHQKGQRPCNVFDVLEDLVEAIKPLAKMQRRGVELCVLSMSLTVGVNESALRQALSNLIEGALLRTQIGGKVEIVSAGTPAGVLITIDDDGPDMHYMTQLGSLSPFDEDLSAENRIQDNMTWNFVAGLSVAREILESYGCIVRVLSPRNRETSHGAGGTRIELWLPLSSDALSEKTDFAREA